MPTANPVNSVDLRGAASFRDHVQIFGDGLITQTFHSHEAAKFSTALEGVKGEMIVNALEVGELTTRYATNFTPQPDKLKFGLRKIKTEEAKVELQFDPRAFERTYLGMFRKPGFNHNQIPFFQDYILGQVLAKVKKELNTAHIRGVSNPNPTANDPLRLMVNGLSQLVNDMANTGEAIVAPLPTSNAGWYSGGNSRDILRDLLTALPDDYLQDKKIILMNRARANRLISDYEKIFQEVLSIRMDGGTQVIQFPYDNCEIRVVPGYLTEDITILLDGALHHAYDLASDTEMFKFQDDVRIVKMWMDFKFGVQIILPEDGTLVVAR